MSWLLALLAAGCAAHGAASHAAASFFVSGGFRGRLLFCFLLCCFVALLLRFVFFVFYLESGIMFIYLRGLKRALDSLLLLPVSHSLC